MALPFEQNFKDLKMRKSILGQLTALSLAVLLSSCSSTPVVYDLLILDGTIVDGSGSPAYASDIAIVDDKIVKMGDLNGSEAERIIDANGLTVTPGFIDLHTHADRNIRDNPGVENYLHQGVTTILAGNCGHSPVDLDAYFKSFTDTGIAVNLAMLIGHNKVRDAVMGNENRAPTAVEQRRMESLVKTAMDDGAFGLSTGLIYLPGTYSETDEVVALARIVAAEGGIYASHIRNEFELLIEAIEEAITIGQEADLPVQISHLKLADNTMWGDSTRIMEMFEAARKEGLDIAVDQYPYTAGSTGLANVFPTWARAGSREDFQARLDDPDIRARVKTDTIRKLNGARAAGDLSRIRIASFENHPEYSGKSMAEVTRMNGYEPSIENGAEVAMKILYDGEGSAIYFMMVEEDVRNIMRDPFTSIASDSSAIPFGENVPHLRNYGTYPRVLARYVRDDGVLSLEQAIYKMTALPASRINLPGRGTLQEGMMADINIFDFDRVLDNDDWANPHQYATGFSYVIVNGQAVVDEGIRTAVFPGKVLKRTQNE